MKIIELIARIDALHEKSDDPNEWDQKIALTETLMEHWPTISAELKRQRTSIEKARTALAEIVNPIQFMRERAEAEGSKLSPFAYELAKDPMHLQEIARLALAALDEPASDARNGWHPIETAPKDKSLMLYVKATGLIYCGSFRYGQWGEPQHCEIAWRCNSSGRFTHPTHWRPMPEAPKGRA